MKTKKPSKQRKKLYKMSLFEKRKYLVAPLDKSLATKIGKKKLTVRKGDTVKVLIGTKKGKVGKVESVNYDKLKVYIKDLKVKNVKGQDKLIPFVASNLLITEAVLDDVKRIKKPQKGEVNGK